MYASYLIDLILYVYVQQEAYGISAVGNKANTRPENIGRSRLI
jgi:hypothetical protein